MSAPASIFRYLDAVDFLHDWLEERRRSNPRFKVAMWLHRHRVVGLTQPVLNNILARRRVPQVETVDALVVLLALDADEGRYLHLLFDLVRAPTLVVRLERLNEVYTHPRFRGERHIEADELVYLTSILPPLLRELSLLRGWSPEPMRIQARLRCEASIEQIEAALLLLHRLGLLDDLYEPVPGEPRVSTGMDARHDCMMRFHDELLRLTQRSLQQVHWQERCFLGATLAVPEEAVPMLRQELYRMLEQVTKLCDTEPGERRNVHQLNIQFFPWTQEVAEAPGSVDPEG